jgi:hypothetical protein
MNLFSSSLHEPPCLAKVVSLQIELKLTYRHRCPWPIASEGICPCLAVLLPRPLGICSRAASGFDHNIQRATPHVLVHKAGVEDACILNLKRTLEHAREVLWTCAVSSFDQSAHIHSLPVVQLWGLFGRHTDMQPSSSPTMTQAPLFAPTLCPPLFICFDQRIL